MARFGSGQVWWGRAVAAALAVGLFSTTQGAEPAAPSKADEITEARALLRDFRELGASLQKEANSASRGPATSDPLKALDRPARTVRKSSLTSAAVDAMLEKSLAEAKTPPARLTTDEEFIRRVTLDVTGALPTPQQVASFVQSKSKSKRAELIDRLLDSPGYARNWASYWREVIQFHINAPNPRFVNLPKFQEWLAEQLAQNTPWDEVARAMIAGNGDTAENGAAVFIAAQGAQPVELAGEVSRVFLGVQIQCAQCHDHPTDPWKREQFHEFAAFFAGTNARNNQQTKSVNVVARGGIPRYTMPDKADPQKQITIAPRFFLAKSSEPALPPLTAQQRRDLVASYITGQDNPWFAKAYINRIWSSLLGDAFYMPIDDIGPTRDVQNPELLDALATEWTQTGYDVRWLFRLVLNTKAYQRASRSSRSATTQTPFAANSPSRLRADQIVRALAQAIDFTPGASRFGNRPNGKGKAAAKKAAGAALARQGGPNNPLVLFGVDPSTPSEDVLGTIPQALFLMNNPQLNRAMSAQNNTMLGKVLNSTPDNRAALEAIYLNVLGRRPNAGEIQTSGHYLAKIGNRKEAFEDILWALINSTEFISRK